MTTENQGNTPTTKRDVSKLVPKYTPQVVKRNEVEGEFKSTFVSRGDNFGWEYPAPDVNETNLDTWVAWMGRKIAALKLGAFLKQMSQGWWEGAEDQAISKEDGKLDVAKAYDVFGTLASAFSARGESIPVLKEQMLELVSQISDADVSDPNYANIVRELADQIKEINIAIEAKRRDKKAESEAEVAQANK